MANYADIARLIEGAGDYDEAIRRLQAAGLATQRSEQSILVSTNITVALVTGGNARSSGHWIVYDNSDPSKLKTKVRAN